MAARGEEAVPVGDETDEEKSGDEDERRPVLGCCSPGLMRGQQRCREEEPATAGGGAPVPGDGGMHRVILHHPWLHRGSVPDGRARETEPIDLSPQRRSGWEAPMAQAGAAVTSVVSSALDSAFHSAQ